MQVFDRIRADVSHLGSMLRGERVSSAGSAGAASAQPDSYASQKAEPPLTPLEIKAVRPVRNKFGGSAVAAHPEQRDIFPYQIDTSQRRCRYYADYLRRRLASP